LSDDADGGAPLVLRCAWCDLVRDRHGAWRRVPAQELRRLEAENRLTHGMCPQCYANLTAGDACYPG
jgi:hypothetical protein